MEGPLSCASALLPSRAAVGCSTHQISKESCMVLPMSARSEATQLPLQHDAYKTLPESLRRVAPELTAEAPPLLRLLLPLHYPPTLRVPWLGLWLLGSPHCTDAEGGHLAGSGFQADRRSPLRPAGQRCPHADNQILHLLTYSKPPCLQVKSRMRNREQYQDFLKCLNMFHRGHHHQARAAEPGVRCPEQAPRPASVGLLLHLSLSCWRVCMPGQPGHHLATVCCLDMHPDRR